LLGAFNCLLNSGGVFGAALLRISSRAVNFIVVAEYLSHALFELGLAKSVACHRYELIWPQLLNLAYLPRCHNDGAGHCQRIELQKLVLLEAQTRKNLTVVQKNLCRVEVWFVLTRKSVRCEQDTLAEEVAQNIVD